MRKAIASKKVILKNSSDKMVQKYMECVRDLWEHELVLQMDEHVQHCNTSRLQHAINVSYYSFLWSEKMGLDSRSAARAGLLHDLYFYSWTTEKTSRKGHLSNHPKLAYENAIKITEVNAVEKDAIINHMWPCTIQLPQYKESYVVTMADKLCTVLEVVERQSVKVSQRKRKPQISYAHDTK